MKRINTLYKSILFLVVITSGLLLASCKRMIEIPANPRNQLSADRVFADSANIMAAIASVYNDFGASSGSLQFSSGLITVFTGLTGDELVPGSDIYSAPAFYTNAVLPDNQRVASMWSAAFKSVFEINLCLQGIANTTAISESLKQQLTGELKVDRAFCYFNMVNIWGAVPIITATDYATTRNIPRSSKDSVFNFIIADLLDAQQKLTANYPSAGRARPNLHVASALLAKVYLYTGKYQEAINAANTVIGTPAYKLETTYNRVFLNGSTEAIWQLPANGIYQAVPEASTFQPYNASSTPNYILSPHLLNAFEAGDLRKTNWTRFNTIGNATVYYPYKYKNLQPTQTPVEDYMLLRLADIHLVRAEALARREQWNDALTDINKVRERTGLTEIKNVSQDSVIRAIAHERQVELFCEWGNRWYDLKRTNRIDAVLGAEKNTWRPAAALFPIPTAELQANPALTPNPN